MADTAAGKANIFEGFFPHIDVTQKENGGSPRESPLLSRRQQQQQPQAEEQRLPQMEVQVMEEWRQEEGYEEPPPDYSDGDEDHDDDDVDETDPFIDEPDTDTVGNHGYIDDYIKPSLSEVREKLSSLSKLDYEAVVMAAESEIVDVPEPDYSEEDGHSSDHLGDQSPDLMRIYTVPGDDSELAQPKKLINPCAESKDRMNLHRELLMNQKMGVDVLGKKTELKKVMERRQDAQKKKETVEFQRSKRSSFEIKLEEQAKKLDFQQDSNIKREKAITEEQALPEFVKVHHRINKHQVTS